jgi:hypothetical protein
MTEQERLEALIAYSASDNRICPIPMKWNQLWLLYGCPSQAVGPPLILSGWAFSSDRDKRNRFKEHLEYALKARLLEEAEGFVRGLGLGEWHTGEESHADRSYGKSLIEDEARRQRAATEAANLFRAPSGHKGFVALGPHGFADLIFLYYLELGGEDPGTISAALRKRIERSADFIKDGKSCLVNDVDADVVAELTRMQEVRQREYLLAEFLVRLKGAGTGFDRDAVEEFTADVFDALRGK